MACAPAWQAQSLKFDSQHQKKRAKEDYFNCRERTGGKQGRIRKTT